MEGLLHGDELAALLQLDLHQFVDLVLALHVFGQLRLQVVDLVLQRLLLLFDQVGVVFLEVGAFLLLQHRQLRLLVERPLRFPLVSLLVVRVELLI